MSPRPISYQQALEAIEALVCIPRLEYVPLPAANGMVIAEDVRLADHQPAFDRATMDGYAVVPDGAVTAFRVMGAVAAGSTFAGELKPGEAVRIMTGAPAPAGTTVVPVEATDGGMEVATVADPKALAPGRNIAWRGEDGKAGDIIVPSGTRMSPATVAVAAMCGCRELTVFWPPSLAIVATGDELGDVDDPVKDRDPASIADSNSPFLACFTNALGLPATRIQARDEAAALTAALAQAADGADIVVTTGGVSAGDRDLVPGAAAALGFTTVFHHVAIQPGKPVFLAQRLGAKAGQARFLIGLPGNPVSVVATAHLFLLPLVGRMLGGWMPGWLELPLTVPWDNPGRRHQFLPARWAPGGIEPLRWNGSGDLIAAAAGDGLVDLPAGASLAAGTTLRFLPYVGGAPGGNGRIPPRGTAG